MKVMLVDLEDSSEVSIEIIDERIFITSYDEKSDGSMKQLAQTVLFTKAFETAFAFAKKHPNG